MTVYDWQLHKICEIKCDSLICIFKQEWILLQIIHINYVLIEGFRAILGFYGQVLRWKILWRNEGFFLMLLIKPTMHPKKPLAKKFAFFTHSADQFPITCSDSPHFKEAAHWLYYHGTCRQGLIKLTGVITRPLPCHGSERRMEQRCDGEGHEAIILQCAQWVFPVTPCRSRFKEWEGWWLRGDGLLEMQTVPVHLGVYVSEEQLFFLDMGWGGHVTSL